MLPPTDDITQYMRCKDALASARSCFCLSENSVLLHCPLDCSASFPMTSRYLKGWDDELSPRQQII